mmetsp:Transcript_58791/g.132468  ORF Transcript_58791/g.132468 Transcript_58791/m.132468 type:complete len:151 (+) Transcript_58791:101-553(+)
MTAPQSPQKLSYVDFCEQANKVFLRASFESDVVLGLGLRKTGTHGYCGTAGTGSRIQRIQTMSTLDIPGVPEYGQDSSSPSSRCSSASQARLHRRSPKSSSTPNLNLLTWQSMSITARPLTAAGAQTVKSDSSFRQTGEMKKSYPHVFPG